MAVQERKRRYSAQNSSKNKKVPSAPKISVFKIFELIGKPFFWITFFVALIITILTKFFVQLILWFLKIIYRTFLKKEKRKKSHVQVKKNIVLSRFQGNNYLPSVPLLFQKIGGFFLFIPSFRKIFHHFPFKKVFIISIFPAIFLIAFAFYLEILRDLPDPNRLLTRSQILTTKIYDRNGELLYKVYRSQNRTLIKLSEVPQSLINATIAIEDAEFYNHRGLSVKGILRAAYIDIKEGKTQGGSTITQQLVKNTLLSPEKTWKRKIKEVILSLLVEQKFTKEQILQMYLNEVGYGGSAYGVEEASQLYFGKSASKLNLTESSFLAGLPAAPTMYSPFGANPERATERQKTVLTRMLQEGFITADQLREAEKEQLKINYPENHLKAPHFVMYIKDLLAKKYGDLMIEQGGLEVKTTLDLSVQEMAQKTIKEEINNLGNYHVTNGAALVTIPQTGEILAMVGSVDYFNITNNGNYNVTTALRQPGSSIKPVNYALALESGFTSSTIISDTPITYKVPGQPPYAPNNYDNRYHGNVTLRTALGSSYNVPAVKVLSALGVSRMVERGKIMGITTWNDSSRFGLSLTLGGGEVQMVDMAVVYGTLANLGTKVDLNPILEVKDYQGKILEKIEVKRENVLEPKIAYLLTDILSDNLARTPAFGPNSQLNIKDHPHVAVKTGTTQNLRDNWAIGYTPDFVATVWVGNNDNSPMNRVASGVTGASPIWNKIMTHLLLEIPDKEFNKPEGLLYLEICPVTNTLSCEGCKGRREYFLPGTEPTTRCDPNSFKNNQPGVSPIPVSWRSF